VADLAGDATARLAEFVAGLSADDVPAEVRTEARWVVLDTVAAMVAGARWQSTAPALAHSASVLGGGDSSVVGTPERGSVAAAAFVNGALSHGLNFDTLGPGNAHVGCAAVPAALAVAESAGRSGAEFLTAVVAAAEVASRVAATASAASPRPGLMLGQVHGYFAAAAGCAQVIGLGPRDVASAFGHAVMQAAGTMEVMRQGDADAKEVYAGFANLGGVLSAQLAAAGVANAPTAFEGDFGYFPLVLGVPAEHLGPLTAGLGSDFLSGDIYYKRWPLSLNVERYAAVLADFLAGHPEITGIESLRVDYLPADGPWIMPLAERRSPATLAAAANSIPYSLAGLLVDRDEYVGALAPEMLTEPRRLALAADIACREVAPDAGRALEIGTREGERHRLAVPARPRPAAGAIHPSERKLRAVWPSGGPTTAEDVIALVSRLEEAPSVNEVCQALRSVATGRPASRTAHVPANETE
jgi:2-methylcitrate dehydratase PrpD